MQRISLLFLLLLLLMPLSAYAAVGLSLEFGGGSGNFDGNRIIFDTDVDTGYANIGFVYDSNPYAEYGNFSYRLNIALERHNFKDRSVTLETGALVFDNTFAFTLAQSEAATFWIGPQIRVGFMSGETDDFDPLEVDGSMFGLGAVVGTNIKTASNLGMGLSAGIRRTALAGDMSESGFSDDFTGHAAESFVNLALLFN
jgi:hypothetical protein